MVLTSEMIFKSRETILTVLQQRGFDVSQYDSIPVSVIHAIWKADQLDMLVKRKDGEQQCFVKYVLGKGMRPTNLYSLIEELFTFGAQLTPKDDLVVITKDRVSESIQKEISTIWAKENILITVIPISCLQYNILEHELVPPHRVMDDNEKKSLYAKYGIDSDDKLPEISVFDPVAQLYCMRPGQVCEIKRPSQTALTTLAYRICKA